ncbi:MAG TPA: DUF222 domain-containing protein, partial [Acidimicrobiales bacterium]
GVVAGFDAELTSARDCVDLVSVFSDLEHAASAGLALAARRVAQTNLWEGAGHRTSAHWLAAKTGMTVGDAMRLLETAEVAEDAPATMDALKNGDLSIRKANAAGKAEAADPDAGAELVERAKSEGVSVREIEQEAARIVNAASGETEQQRAEKIRKQRSFRIGSSGDGSSWFHGVGPTAEVARLEAALKPLLNDIFQDARQQGRREPVDAYTFDALMALADRPRMGSGSDEGPAREVDPSDDGWSFAKVIVRADLAALDRGHVEPGELCEIAGQGPVPVADVWKIIDGGAFIAGIVTDGTQIDRVRHYGRHPTVLQRTVLEWETAGTCAVEGCTNPIAIEIDHVADWANTHLTQIGDLAAICRSCHAKKTYEGFTLGPRLPTGKRRLIPPSETSPPPCDASIADGPDEPEQPGLFDTG